MSHVRKRIRGAVKKQRIIDGKEEDLDLTLPVHNESLTPPVYLLHTHTHTHEHIKPVMTQEVSGHFGLTLLR